MAIGRLLARDVPHSAPLSSSSNYAGIASLLDATLWFLFHQQRSNDLRECICVTALTDWIPMATSVSPSTIVKFLITRHPVAIQVEANWRSSPFPGLRKLTCEYCDGMLTIQGQVTSYYLKQMARVTARELFPEARLRNGIEVAPGKPSAGQPHLSTAAPPAIA